MSKFKLNRTNRESISPDAKSITDTTIAPTVVKSLETKTPYVAPILVAVAPAFTQEKIAETPIEAKHEVVAPVIEKPVNDVVSNVMGKIPRSVQTLKIASCYPHELFQPRTYFDASELQALADNMKKLGQVQPIIVVQDEDKYLIVSGERRFRALKLNNAEFIDAVVLKNKYEAVEIAYFDNEARSNLSFIEKLVYWRKLLDSGWATNYKEIADRLGVEYQFVARASKVHLIPEDIKKELIRTKAGRPAVVKALQDAEKSPVEKANKNSEIAKIKFTVEEKNGIPLSLSGLGSANVKTLEYIVSEASRMIKNLKN
jgi:ParB/RepB/Spo0J family partition protein